MPIRNRGDGNRVKLHSLDVRCVLQPQSNHTDGRHVLIHPVQTQLERLPLGRQPDSTRFASAQRPPIPASLVLSPEQVREPYGHVTDNWILEEISVVDDLDRDYGGLFIGTHEFRDRLPHGIVGMLEGSRSVGWRGLVAQVDLYDRVEIARHRFAVVEVFGLVEDQSNYTDV